MVQPQDNRTVLIVDDDPSARAGLKRLLYVVRQELPLRVIEADDAKSAMVTLARESVDCVLLDQHMPGKTGLEWLREVTIIFPSLAVVMVTGDQSAETAVAALRAGASDYLVKGSVTPERLVEVMRAAVGPDRSGRATRCRGAVGRSAESVRPMGVVGGYRLIRELGEGGQSTVYAARPAHDREETGAEYALKLFRMVGLSAEDRRVQTQRFLNEAKSVARIHHPNVIRLVDFGVTPEVGAPYLVQELITGKSLADWIADGNHWGYRRKASILCPLADALQVVHEAGIVHRDIKPENILIAEDLTVKLMDFGIAQMPHSRLTSGAHLLGSPAYMAPESWQSTKIDARSDVFSLGVVAYELLLGVRPFDDESLPKLAMKIINAEFVPPGQRDARLPRVLVELVESMLAADPAGRCPSMAAVAGILREFLDATPAPMPPPRIVRLGKEHLLSAGDTAGERLCPSGGNAPEA
ncbi:MAG: hypothetical protein A3K19_31185 [Lentisphaerae bacterium RIFOXYB12_FULL_65_16]|nr:MAG: hypothetical protein A3K18_20475 [Lentisphaerae bacterium RIFOXYA12_64_32]OGV88901.1 MAG: hypothetical protein A3K19_31185 [Lentisphaerae bacterium RIFOXYB12_FULL_65_16]